MRCCRPSSPLRTACAKAGWLGLIQRRASTSSSSSPSMCCVLTSRCCTASLFATRAQRPESSTRTRVVAALPLGTPRPATIVQVRRPHHAQIPRVGGEHRQRAAGAHLSPSGSHPRAASSDTLELPDSAGWLLCRARRIPQRIYCRAARSPGEIRARAVGDAPCHMGLSRQGHAQSHLRSCCAAALGVACACNDSP